MYSVTPPCRERGRSKLMTCMTFLISKPRAETPVATRIGHRAVRKARLLLMLERVVSWRCIHLQSIFTLTLSTVGVNRGAGQAHVEQIVVQEIGLRLGVDEDQGTRGRHGKKKVVEALLLQAILGVDDLRKVCMSVPATIGATRDLTF